MSGIEVAGLVLGGFPVLLECLSFYRKSFEPLEEWWNFRTHFIAFVDDIRHQTMRYNENLIRLLDPIVTNNEDLLKLVADPADPRWKDGSLDGPLEQRLSSELDRFLRIVSRMKSVMDDLNKLLQIENGKVSWQQPQQSWQWQYKRLQLSFSKGKHKKVKKLAAHNQELQDILGYSERLIPISDRRQASGPVESFEKMRKHACLIHRVLRQQWNCRVNTHCHEAHLKLEVLVEPSKTNNLSVLFKVDNSGNPIQEVVIRAKVLNPTAARAGLQIKQSTSALELQSSEMTSAQVASVHQSTPLKSVQEAMLQKDNKRSLLDRMSQKLLKQSSTNQSAKRKVMFDSTSTISISVTPAVESSVELQAVPGPEDDSQQQSIVSDLCAFLCEHGTLRGMLRDEFDRHLELSKLPRRRQAPSQAGQSLKLLTLPELLKAYHEAQIDVPRQRRFEIAAHIASALLQTHSSPWLPTTWSKERFMFLADATNSLALCSSHPFVAQDFSLTPTDVDAIEDENNLHLLHTLASCNPLQQAAEESTRACLFTMGVMILELIFGHNIEDCTFRKDYYGKDNKPNDQTDISTARKWAKKVLGESGANISDVVRRCLDCSFGPRPSFADVRFRESVYEGVIKPLAAYSRVWPEAMP
ncbi:hypothetical protein B0T26DRAFT_691523 [Lasiosphaeria miniovina]|uniref:DUF7580 domain-containing protein n=1 Tax=Lasiosphaeria miniovina TaxID=1954250 RepID=A0AA40B2Z9_9PEZI|nr:uncharacterized protein B0T26DRAFT_691523 [Lasiosphaeria miniovina]KAK0726731.1 hypothetical protein B0T26DRAFT_691523 [Lasiosphaeria miniovina]